MKKEVAMEFLNISGFSIPPGKSRDFQAWVRANSDALAKAAPEGIELVGIYAAIFSSEKASGAFKIVWRHQSYGDMDRFSEAAAQEGEFSRLLDELGAFTDVRLGAHSSNELLKSVSDISIWADYPEG